MDNNKNKIAGVVLGIVSDNENPDGIGIGVIGGTMVMSVAQAAIVFDQLGNLLDVLGYFDEDEGCETCH
jgi:hypothetical protein